MGRDWQSSQQKKTKRKINLKKSEDVFDGTSEPLHAECRRSAVGHGITKSGDP
jgi:hypothetical protein